MFLLPGRHLSEEALPDVVLLKVASEILHLRLELDVTVVEHPQECFVALSADSLAIDYDVALCRIRALDPERFPHVELE